MYHIAKPLGEWMYHGCEPAPGARPVSMDSEARYVGAEPAFDIHDVRPTSRKGDKYLSRLHDTMRGREYNDLRARSLDMQINPPHFSDWGIKPKRTEKVKTMSTNVAMAEALLDNFNTISVEMDHNIYMYKVPKDMELEKGDHVIVPNKDKFKAVMVIEVFGCNKNPDEIKLRWVVQKVDYTEYDKYIAKDEKAISTIMELEKRKTKRDLVNELTNDLSAEETLQLSTDLGIDVCESTD